METPTSPVRTRADLIDYPVILRQADLARAFGVTRQTIVNRLAAGTLRLEPINAEDGGRLLWSKRSLENYLLGPRDESSPIAA